jgi:putative ABC transport system ATP-binding protein
LINDPSIILADEPIGNMDSTTGEKIIKLLKNLNKEKDKTVIIVTHNPFVAQFGFKRINLKDGAILSDN